MASFNEHTSISHDISPVESATSYDSDLCCLKCDLTFYHIIDLQGHFMSSSFHPTCIPCGQGFLDDVAYRIHLQTSHLASPSSRPNSKLSSPVLSPPRSLRSLVSSPRLQSASPTTSRVASPFPRNSSPTFFTSRSSRSTRSNSPHSSISPQPESRTDASTVVPHQPMTDIPAASVSPRPSSAPSTTRIIVTEPPQAGLEPPPVTPIVIAPPPVQNTKRLGLRMPEPLCTVELMTPSVLGDESPTYESSRSSTPERLTTPSSLNSYNEDARSPTSPAPVQGHFTAAPSSVSLAGTSPASPASPAFSPPAVRAELDFGQPDTRTSSRVSFTTMATAREVADRVESPSRVSSPTTTEPVLNSPVVTTIPVEPTQEDISSEPYRAEYHGVDQCPSDARGSERVVDAKSSSDTSEYTADSEPPRKNPPTYTSRRSSSIQHSGRTQSRDTSSDSRTKVLSGQTSWHCRLCMDEPHEPTVTMCGHLFCHRCIVAELSKNFQCPVCKKMMLVRLHVD
ncbi:hypothetical protein BC629DRAFT_1587205 [Irpex lacteus]|nr:hypothetical protein BC629DRAFT_1587205 [Irpex lacteus]